MSRIGNMPITIPAGIEVKQDGQTITVKGKDATLSLNVHPSIIVEVKDNVITVKRPNDEKQVKALHGLTRSLINNMVIGVSEGYSKTLELVGVGYRASLKGDKLEMTLGYSHPVDVQAIEGIKFECPDATTIIISGVDKQLVGQTAAEIRSLRAPEPYKGKGIRYQGEHIRRKEGKAAK